VVDFIVVFTVHSVFRAMDSHWHTRSHGEWHGTTHQHFCEGPQHATHFLPVPKWRSGFQRCRQEKEAEGKKRVSRRGTLRRELHRPSVRPAEQALWSALVVLRPRQLRPHEARRA